MPSNKIELFLCNTQQPVPEKLLNKYLNLLPASERMHLTKLSGSRWKNQLVSLALLYSELAAKTGEPSDILKIDRNANGKPYLENFSQYQFNMSHSKDFIALAIGKTDPIGLDLEKIDFSRRNLPHISERFFPSIENEVLLKYTGKERTLMFYRIWTLREAWVKANGEALIPNMKNIEFLIEESKCIINAETKLRGGQFFLYRSVENFFLAFCSLGLNLKLKDFDFAAKRGLPLQRWENIDQLELDCSIQTVNL